MDSSAEVKADPRRALPAVDRLARQVAAAGPELPGWAVTEGSRRALERARERLSRARDPERDAAVLEGLQAEAEALAREVSRPHPARVVNATGIVLHTNLGRAPLAARAAAAVAGAAEGYGDLELDLESGRRGDRGTAVAAKLRLASGAAGALAVNNNAAAVMLALSTFAAGREVVVSRGELVEIGGSFRVPEILESAGARLVEVGTTNRTHPADYERAIGPETALLLKVHRSNFELRGFVTEVSLAELAGLAHARNLLLVEDLGSGTLLDLSAHGLPAEACAPSRLRQGADLVCFSGDKLLGGPQAGLVLGADAAAIEAMRRNPLARALRLDKLGLAALDATLAAYLEGTAEEEIPVLRQLTVSEDALERRARALAARLEAVVGREALAVERDLAFAGGGSLPGFELPTRVVALRPPGGAERCAERLRRAARPVLARVRDGAVVFDVRTLLDGEDAVLADALREALR